MLSYFTHPHNRYVILNVTRGGTIIDGVWILGMTPFKTTLFKVQSVGWSTPTIVDSIEIEVGGNETILRSGQEFRDWAGAQKIGHGKAGLLNTIDNLVKLRWGEYSRDYVEANAVMALHWALRHQ